MKGRFEIQVDEKYVMSYVQGGIQQNSYYSQDLDAYALNMAKRGWELWNGDGCLHAIVKELIIDEFLLVMSLDLGQVYKYTPYIKILDSNKDNLVVEGLPNRLHEVGEVKTWHEWFNPTENFHTEVIDGYRYYLSYAPLSGNGFLLGSELMIIHNSTDATLVEALPVI